MPTPNMPAQSGFNPKNLWLSIGALLLVGSGVAAGVALSSRPQAAAPAATASSVTEPVQQNPVPQEAAAPVARQRHAVATVCASCGVVASVTAVEQQGEGTGAGAVVGGLLGGVAGHQMGGGSGKTALTVLGAIGGGLAGNEVEKRSRSQTTYTVSVRMDDGSMRTVSQDQASVVRGDRVSVEGRSVRRIDGATS